ncbi:hypothetical protein CRG98_018374 [Punica granatum]|uniref:Uncharacterized protein n=1 Tax=Punica granatum TaxID=22663 RepID=A0A2I0K0I2_PUNGR|nr:hypothetical protein CRG98_018374 [Punica granatum]
MPHRTPEATSPPLILLPVNLCRWASARGRRIWPRHAQIRREREGANQGPLCSRDLLREVAESVRASYDFARGEVAKGASNDLA